jgi:hypothetical protein
MKKWIIGFITITVTIIGSIYLFIPNTITIRNTIGINATRQGLYRMLLDKNSVEKWWPGKTTNDSFFFNDFTYRINNSNITVLPVFIKGQNVNLSTSLFLVALNKDSTQLEWVTSTTTSYNILKRFSAYLRAKKIKYDMATILQKMEVFYSVPKNIYDFEIKKELVMDSFLIATSGKCKGYPSNEFIYSLINKLRNYATLNIAKETGYPMLNINKTDSVNFDVKVAIPTDKLLSSSGEILQKRMPGRGNILVTEVTGGNSITKKAYDQVQKYADDYQRNSPAIPFYSLITDRLKEPDTTKWVTKIYFPVM